MTRGEILALIDRRVERVIRRLASSVRRGVIRRVNDDRAAQEVQVEGWIGRDGVERWQGYGFTAHPQDGAEALVIQVGGDADHPIVIATEDRRYRVKVEAGEVAIYDDQGQAIALRRERIEVIPKAGAEVLIGDGSPAAVRVEVQTGGEVEITAPGGSVNVSAGVSATVEAPTVSLGPAGFRPSVARAGDPVSVSGTVGGAPVTLTGQIVSGSSAVAAG